MPSDPINPEAIRPAPLLTACRDDSRLDEIGEADRHARLFENLASLQLYALCFRHDEIEAVRRKLQQKPVDGGRLRDRRDDDFGASRRVSALRFRVAARRVQKDPRRTPRFNDVADLMKDAPGIVDRRPRLGDRRATIRGKTHQSRSI